MELPDTTPKTWNIYFVRGTESGKIMIRKTDRDPEFVLNTLAVHENCDLIKSILGTSKLRENLHQEFESLAIDAAKNWYNPHPELTNRIDSIQDFDGEEPPPPTPISQPKKREYVNPFFYCELCGFEAVDESMLLQLDNDYIDWGSLHDPMYESKASKHLCRECAFKGGLTNSVFKHFRENRMHLAPYWDENDEIFLGKCSNEPDIYEGVRFIWIKCRVFVRNMLGRVLIENPTADLNTIRSSIIEQIEIGQTKENNRRYV